MTLLEVSRSPPPGAEVAEEADDLLGGARRARATRYALEAAQLRCRRPAPTSSQREADVVVVRVDAGRALGTCGRGTGPWRASARLADAEPSLADGRAGRSAGSPLAHAVSSVDGAEVWIGLPRTPPGRRRRRLRSWWCSWVVSMSGWWPGPVPPVDDLGGNAAPPAPAAAAGLHSAAPHDARRARARLSLTEGAWNMSTTATDRDAIVRND